MAHYHSDYFVSTEQAHYGFIRSRPSLLLFLFGMYFLSSVFSITLYKLRSRALCTQSNSGSLESPKLHRALAVPCVKSRARDSHKGATDVALLCPTVKTSCVSLFFHVAFQWARYHSHKSRTTRAAETRREKAAPVGFSPPGEMGILCILPIRAEHPAHSMGCLRCNGDCPRCWGLGGQIRIRYRLCPHGAHILMGKTGL